jgi:hypothetical protein
MQTYPGKEPGSAMPTYARFAEAIGDIHQDAAAVFDFLDDQANLSAHMSRSSGMMLGSTMNIHMEPDHTRRVGSRFGFTGRVLGVPLEVDEIVTGRVPPSSKTWETTSEPKLWVIGSYQMGSELMPRGDHTTLRVYIRYDLPASGLPRVLGHLFGRFYAQWCTRKMVDDAREHFSREIGEARAPA